MNPNPLLKPKLKIKISPRGVGAGRGKLPVENIEVIRPAGPQVPVVTGGVKPKLKIKVSPRAGGAAVEKKKLPVQKKIPLKKEVRKRERSKSPEKQELIMPVEAPVESYLNIKTFLIEPKDISEDFLIETVQSPDRDPGEFNIFVNFKYHSKFGSEDFDLTKLDLKKYKSLKTVDIFNVIIRSLDGLPNTLEVLECDNCGLTTLEGSPKNLTSLLVPVNNLSTLKGAEKLDKLINLDVSSNQLFSMLHCPDNVKVVFCGNNKSLSSIEDIPLGVNIVDITGTPLYNATRIDKRSKDDLRDLIRYQRLDRLFTDLDENEYLNVSKMSWNDYLFLKNLSFIVTTNPSEIRTNPLSADIPVLCVPPTRMGTDMIAEINDVVTEFDAKFKATGLYSEIRKNIGKSWR